MEEDIKILEDLAKILDRTCESGKSKSSTSIRNLIKGYRELEEENEIYKEELEKIDKALNLEAGRVAPYRHEIIISLKKGIVQLNKIIGNSIPKSKIKEIVDECIPKGKNIITGEEEYQPNTNANSFLTQSILELMEDK